MSQDFRKIAEDAVAQCKAFEARINELQKELSLSKKAGVDPELVKKSVEALTKQGGIAPNQAEQTAELLAKDPNAPLRAIKALCDRYTDAAPILKQQSDIEGGKLVGSLKKKASAKISDRDAAYDAVAKALGLNMNK